jgi:hypothetical protein
MGNNKVAEKILRNGRWHVRLETSIRGRKTVPLAWYVWLKGNPGFKDIPDNYVVHHLDHDELNDDISNLVIMSRYHHTAHHILGQCQRPD